MRCEEQVWGAGVQGTLHELDCMLDAPHSVKIASAMFEIVDEFSRQQDAACPAVSYVACASPAQTRGDVFGAKTASAASESHILRQRGASSLKNRCGMPEA